MFNLNLLGKVDIADDIIVQLLVLQDDTGAESNVFCVDERCPNMYTQTLLIFAT